MASVTIAVPAAPAKRPKSYLLGAGGLKVEVGWAPLETVLDGSSQWALLSRPGRRPIVRYDEAGLLTLSFTAAFGSGSTQQSGEAAFKNLGALARSNQPVRFSYGADGAAAAQWVITACSRSSVTRTETNQVSRFTAAITLTEYVTAAVAIGKTTTKTTASSSAASGAAAAAGRPPAVMVVKKGDTLFAIAYKVYGNGTLWPKIAKANGIKDPRKLQVGTRLKIPKA